MTGAVGDRLRLFHVIADLHVGGAETALTRLVERWQAAGHENVVVNLTTDGSLAGRIAASGARVVELGLARGRIPGPAVMRLRDACRDARPDVVQGWMYHGNLAASLAAALLASRGAPVLWNVRHSLTGPVWPKRLTRYLIRAGAPLSRATARVVYCSAVSAAQHERIGYAAARSVMIPNGVDSDLFRPDPAAGGRLRALLGVGPGVPLVGLFARHDPMKDHASLLAAAALLRARDVPVHLVLAGEGVGPDNAELAAAVGRTGLAGGVSLLGVRDDVDRLMPGLDAFALTSAYGEAFPNVLIEAMASGVPCVATDVGESALILADTGLVVPPCDAAALAAALERLLAAAPDERSRRGEAARRRVLDRYALPTVAERYLRLYRGVLAERGTSRRGSNGEVSACAD